MNFRMTVPFGFARMTHLLRRMKRRRTQRNRYKKLIAPLARADFNLNLKSLAQTASVFGAAIMKARVLSSSSTNANSPINAPLSPCAIYGLGIEATFWHNVA
jgi:hypothetical protein